MGKSSIFFALAMMSTSIVSAIFLPPLINHGAKKMEAAPFAMLLGKSRGLDLLRRSRGANEKEIEDATPILNATSVHVYEDPCTEFFNCALFDSRANVRNFIQFNFNRGVALLDSTCPMGDSSACPIGDCTDTSAFYYAEMSNRVMGYICAQASNFTAGAQCWVPPFSETMHTCVEDIEVGSPFSPEIDDLLTCFAGVPGQLDNNCTQADSDLVAEFTQTVVDIGRDVYGEGFF